jgi:CyaY protein
MDDHLKSKGYVSKGTDTMNEVEFMKHADELLQRIEAAIEVAADKAGVDIDVEMQAGGVLQLEFENATQIIINRHTASCEIWVAARSGGFHFRHEAGRWIGTRDGQELWGVLSHLIAEQSGATVTLTD